MISSVLNLSLYRLVSFSRCFIDIITEVVV